MKFREEETLRYLGAKGAPDEQTSALLRDAAAQLDAIAAPRHAVLRVRAELSGTRVTLGAFQADCAALAAHLAGCGAAYLFAATLGAEVDRAMARLAKLDVARAFALQARSNAFVTIPAPPLHRSAQRRGFICARVFRPVTAVFPLYTRQTCSGRSKRINGSASLKRTRTCSHRSSPSRP